MNDSRYSPLHPTVVGVGLNNGNDSSDTDGSDFDSGKENLRSLDFAPRDDDGLARSPSTEALYSKKLTSQQRTRRLLNGDDPWKYRRGGCCARCQKDDDSISGSVEQRRKRKRKNHLFKSFLTRGSHVALSTFVFIVLIKHENSPLARGLFPGVHRKPSTTTSSISAANDSRHDVIFSHNNNIFSSKVTSSIIDADDGGHIKWTGLTLPAPFVVSYVALFFVALALYFATCLRDPGFVPRCQDESSATGKFWNHYDGAGKDPYGRHRMPHDPSKPLLRECGFCGIQPPLRSRHCEECGLCVLRFDHHCPWLDTCVGQRNHSVFWWFLLAELLLLGASVYMTWRSLSPLVASGMTFPEWLLDNVVLFINMVILIPSTCMVLGLISFHTYLASVNSTTWEMTSRHRITYLAELEDDLEPFDAGACCNLLQFCCLMTDCRSPSTRLTSGWRWEKQYLRAVAKHDEECALEMDAL